MKNYGCPFCGSQQLLAGFNDLQTVNPDLASQWHPTLNGSQKPSDVAPQSNKKAFWLCPVGGENGPEHSWEANIQSRHKGNGCPYCGNRKVLTGFNDLATKRPDIAAEWHPTENGDITPETIAPGSNKKVWWLCANSHEWQAIINNRTSKGSGCKQCNKAKPKVARETVASISTLASSWHPDNDKSSAEVTLGSLYMAKWICDKDSRHVWSTTVANRDRGGNCTVCSGHTIMPGINDLATTHPDFAAQWHPDNEYSVTEVGSGTEYSAKWICEHSHVWKTFIYARIRQDQGCPECLGRSIWQEEKRTVSQYPHLMDKWHLSNTLDPSKVAWRSAKTATWQCPTDSRHVWQAKIGEQNTDYLNCPVCSGRLVIPGVNDFKSQAPETILSEWSDKNTIDPASITLTSMRIAQWQCPNDSSHTWSCTVYERTRKNRPPRRCAECYGTSKRSAGEDDLYENVVALLEGTDLEAFQSVRDQIGGQELDIFIPDAKFAIEFNGLYYHSAKFLDPDYHEKKLEACHNAGVRLHAVWEDDWLERPDQVMAVIARRLGLTEERTRLPKAVAVVDFNDDKRGDAVAFLDANEPNKARLMESVSDDAFVVGVEDPAGLRSAMAYMVSEAGAEGNANIVTVERFHVDSTFDLRMMTDRIHSHYPNAEIRLYGDLSASNESDYSSVGFVFTGRQEPHRAMKDGHQRIEHTQSVDTDDAIYDYGRTVFIYSPLVDTVLAQSNLEKETSAA